ncbi:MAG: amidophosphoribosyltransferase [Actinobacteria bacterium]|nr:amidophosphoribosyltransferase [Actinomycetota bacterium]
MKLRSQEAWNDDKFHDECGVFGVYAPGEDVARLTYFGLHALQHRGQESAGIAVADGVSILVYKDLGLVPQVFSERTIASLTGHIAVGHVRYSTTGSTRWENAQPVHKDCGGRSIVLAHNGNLINAHELRAELEKEGRVFTSTSDSEVMASLIALNANGSGIEGSIIKAMERLKGAYSALVATEEKLYAMRDPNGIRPLALGRLKKGWAISSETCGLDIVGAEYVRDVEPGELLVIDTSGPISIKAFEPARRALCIFEYVYFARPDSRLRDQLIYRARRAMGRFLAAEAPAGVDLIIGVPDSGTPAAIGFAEGAGIPFGEGLIKNRYVGRTFIEPSQTIRQLGVRMKLNPLSEVIKGRKLALVDDSIVRGTTSKKIVAMLKKAGAAEIHMRISSPPVAWPCFYGIDTANRNELIASSKSVYEIAEFIGADTLNYLSLDGLIKATGGSKDTFCSACFDGDYPLPVPRDVQLAKFMLEEGARK